MSNFRLVFRRAAFDDLPEDKGVQLMLAKLSGLVVDEAKELAPRRTGAGADSIDYEFKGREVHISWSARYPYMKYQEQGTRKMRAQPFLSRAIRRKYRDIR